MITVDSLIARMTNLRRPDLERWIGNEWVRPDEREGQYVFRDIDVARVRLILELRDDMDINEDVLPVVLSLLDQLYDLRRRMRELSDALERTAPDNVRRELAKQLTKRTS